MGLSCSRYGPLVDFCEHCNVSLGSVKGREFLE
jgi:hypothetical protein